MALFLRVISFLPLWLLYLLSDILAFTAYHLARYRREVVINNLRQCFPTKSEGEIRQIAKRFYVNLSDVIIESIKAISISRKNLATRVTFPNINVLDKYVQKQQPVVYLTSHQCNWEWMLLGGCLHLPYPVDAMYQRIKTKWAEKLMLKTRSRFGGYPVRSDHTREIIKRSKDLRSVAMVADQLPHIGNRAKYWGELFGKETAFYMGGEQMPKLLNAVVLFAYPRRVRRGYYEIDLVELGQPPYDRKSIEILPAYIREMEKMIRANPSDWLWSHKRWKYTREEERRILGES